MYKQQKDRGDVLVVDLWVLVNFDETFPSIIGFY